MASTKQAEIAIVTIAKNDSRGLERTLSSVREQKFSDWYCHVVIGGSDQETYNLVEYYVNLDPRFEWSRDSGEGLYSAMNDGILRTKSQYILFLNAGDSFFGNQALSALYESIHGTKYSLVVGSFLVHGESRYRTRPRKREFSARDFSYSRRWANHQSIMFRRKNCQHLYETKYSVSADFGFILQHLLGETGLRIQETVALVEPNGISDKRIVLGLIEKCIIRASLFQSTQDLFLNVLWTLSAITKRIIKKILKLA